MKPIIYQDDFMRELKKRGLTLNQACHLIFNKTGLVMPVKHVATQLQRQGKLSIPQAVCFSLLFIGIENDREV